MQSRAKPGDQAGLVARQSERENYALSPDIFGPKKSGVITIMAADKASTRRVLGASLSGTAIEFYDFYIYSTAAALVFGPLFFPGESPEAQLLSSYAAYAVAFVARPIGALAFGHVGDRIGRKATLVVSLMIMGLSTMMIGFLPGYAAIGWAAPALLVLLRFGQGIGLGGEWGGAALLAVENAPPGWRMRFGMFPPLGAPLGFLLANGLFLMLGLVMAEDDFISWGWRIPFLLSVVLIGVGLWVRLKISETPAFQAVLDEGPPSRVPLAEVFSKHGPSLFGGLVTGIACFVIFNIATVFALGYGTTTLGYDREAFLIVQLGSIVFMAAGIVTSGYWGDARGAGHVLRWGCLAGVVAGIAFGPLISAGHPLAALSLILFVMGLVYGPLGGWLPSLFPARVRYTGTSITFNAAGIFGGAMTPFVAQKLSEISINYVGYYMSAACVLSLIGLAMVRGREEFD